MPWDLAWAGAAWLAAAAILGARLARRRRRAGACTGCPAKGAAAAPGGPHAGGG